MNTSARVFSEYVSRSTIDSLKKLSPESSEAVYKSAMTHLGVELGHIVASKVVNTSKFLLVSTAEDADYLSKGVFDSLVSLNKKPFVSVFWNNHYSILDGKGKSVAPIVHSYLQPGYSECKELVVIKSVISGSCVVRANILALIEKVKFEKVYIVSPVMHKDAAQKLKDEFPESISSLFEFIFFATDSIRDNSGMVIPGIGGQVYSLLGLDDQPAKTGFMPSLVQQLMFSSPNSNQPALV